MKARKRKRTVDQWAWLYVFRFGSQQWNATPCRDEDDFFPKVEYLLSEKQKMAMSKRFYAGKYGPLTPPHSSAYMDCDWFFSQKDGEWIAAWEQEQLRKE